MKLGTFTHKTYTFIGAVVGNAVVDLAAAADALPEYRNFRHVFADMRTLLADPDQAAELLETHPGLKDYQYRLSELEIQAPIVNPNKIICVGLNYLDHAIESKMEIPTEPVIFTKFRTSLVGPGQPIVIPRISQQIDYEAELAFVIGKPGKEIPKEEAMEHVAGYTIFNDVSARDLQKRGGQWTKGKALDTFAPMGPFLITGDELAASGYDPHHLAICLELNGNIMQNSSTSQLIFNIPRLVSFLSELFTLETGDVIATGTPPGVGMARKPPVYLRPGDTVKITIAGIGELFNPVVAASSFYIP